MNHAHEPSRSLPALLPPGTPSPRPRAFVSISADLPPLPPPLDEAPEEFVGLIALTPVPTERKMRDHALVLQSMSIWHIYRRSYMGWVLLVRGEDYNRAAQSIDNYEAENRDWPPRPARERPRHAPSMVVPLSFAALVLFFFLVTGAAAHNSRWFLEGTAKSSLILSSEPFRAVTALTLHADQLHVLGNAVSGTIFTTAVQRRLGSGAALLTVLASGVLGNVANAFFHHRMGMPGHLSIGASTAVFGAVGLLAATQLAMTRPATAAKRSWIDIVAPLVGGLALLGALGSGGGEEGAASRVDFGAHLFGFVSGVLIGLGVGLPLRRSKFAVDMGSARAGHTVEIGLGAPSRALQATLGAMAVSIVIGAWYLALRR